MLKIAPFIYAKKGLNMRALMSFLTDLLIKFARWRINEELCHLSPLTPCFQRHFNQIEKTIFLLFK